MIRQVATDLRAQELASAVFHTAQMEGVEGNVRRASIRNVNSPGKRSPESAVVWRNGQTFEKARVEHGTI